MARHPTIWIRNDPGSDRYRLRYISWGRPEPDSTGLSKDEAITLARKLQKSTGCWIVGDKPAPTIQ